MPPLETLLEELRRKQVKVLLSGDQLKLIAPQGALTPELRERLKAHKPALMDFLRGAQRTPSAVTRLRPMPRPDEIPLSYAQEGAWLTDQLQPGLSFNIVSPARVTGKLDLNVLQAAASEVVRRHEALRTTFSSNDDGEPFQVIHDPQQVPVPVKDLEHAPPEAKEAELMMSLLAASQLHLDLSRGPLFHLAAIRMGPEDHVIVPVVHHSVFDGRSVNIFWSELVQSYRSRQSGGDGSLGPPPSLQYTDYALWQRQLLSGTFYAAEVDYWREKLDEYPRSLNLATDKTPSTGQLFKGDAFSLELSPRLSAGLRSLARREGVTLFMLLLAAFRTLLMRYGGQEDIVVGTPVANRSHEGLENVIGFCVNLLALRTDLSGNPSFRELLRRERDTCLGAYSHQELPFGLLVKELEPDRSLGHSPFYQVQFAIQELPDPVLAFPNQALQMRPLFETATQREGLNRMMADATPAFDYLSLTIIDTSTTLSATMQYRADLFEQASIERMLEHLRSILEGVVSDPTSRVLDVPLITSSERAQLLTGFNPKEVEPPAGVALHQLLEHQAELTPDAVAVVVPGSSSEGWAEEQRLSYAQLNRRANQIARHLAGRGVGPESRVGICLERSPDLVAAVWGVLKTGAAYVPLDLSYGVERVKFMLADSGAALVVTHRALVDSSLGVEVTVVDLDQQAESIAAQPDTNLAVAVDPEQLAYLIYTSGSTGRPKGVMVSQRSLLVTYHAWAKTYRLDQLRAHLQMASFSFDVFAGDLVRSLCSGAALVLCPREALLQPEELTGIIERYRIDCAEFVPAVIRPLIEHLEQDRVSLSSLKLVVVGADLWYGSEYHQLADLLGPGVRLINSYGVTEATIDNLYYERGTGELAAQAPVPIGLPYPNCRIYLLDPYLGLVPPGAAGELYLGGSAVARGYAGRPDLSAERFVPDPFGELAGQRLYRTGDRARYLPDGNLAFLGRSDYQIKIRGFRIEPGEIEAVLEQHPAVGQAVVIGRGEEPDSQRLAAYLVASGEAPPTPAELRAHLEKSLPAYMVPASFTVLESLPLTPSGKVDRQSLPDPAISTSPASEYVFPTTVTEVEVTRVWAEVLGMERAGIYDDFFAHGGHSLLAAKLIARLRRDFDVELPLRAVLESPTPAGLSLAIDAARFAAATQLPPIEPVPREELIPLSYAQEGAWFAEQMAPGNPFHIPLAVRLEGELDLERLERALARLMARHESLRTSFAAIDGQPHQVIHQLPPVLLEVVDLRRVEEEGERTRELIRRMIDSAAQPFDLEQGPLFRIKVFRLGEGEQVLFFGAHHIVFDGHSVAIFARDLTALYESEATGLPAALPPLPIQYPDYAAWQRRILSGEFLESQLDYWRTQLQGCPPGLVLAAAGRGQARESDTVSALLTPELSSALRVLSQQEGCTLFMVMLAAFKALLARYTGQEDIVVGTPIANRNQPEMAEVIGFCVNLLALRTDLSGNPSFRELVRRERQTCLGAYSHQELPFGVMVKHLRLDAQLGKSPFLSVGFSLNQPAVSAVGRPVLDPSSPEDLEILRGELEKRWGGLTAGNEQIYLQMVDSGDRIGAVLHHSSSLWGKGTLNRMIGHLETLLAGAVAAPDTPLHQLPLLEPEERAQLLTGFNPKEVEYPAGVALHQLLEHQAELTPDAVAVVVPGSSSEGWAEEQRLSYAQLNRRANQIARHLAGRGVGPESRVGICLERTPDLVAAVWGVLKTGAAYVPLDLSYGVERVKFMLADSGAALVVTHRALVDSLLGVGVTVVDLDQQAESIAAQPDTNLAVAVDPEQLAYLIYTSGSTGRPKGVMVSQRSLLVTYHAWAKTYRLDQLRAHLQMASFSFDVFAGDLVRALCSGAALVLCPREALLQPEELTGIIERYRIDCAEFVPAVIRPLIEHLEQDRVSLSSLKLVVVGADLWYGSEYHQLANLLGPGVRLINSYGVTEATIDNLYYQRGQGELAAEAPVPIGLPYPNCRLYLLDPYLGLVPPGAAGELYLGGAAVARGYAGRPDLSAERFVPDPFGELAGQRLYRTGDRARYLPDGNLAFLGRSDYQIKIRGFRIEPGEIEAVLEQHPAVGQAVVIGRGEEPESQQLAAYLVASGEAPPTPAQLRSWLERSLPAHMVPASFTVLESLPLTPSGKVDRPRLPDPDGARAQLREYVAPRSPQEASLALIWGEVLGVERVGVYDDFFAHGGHSLLAAKLVARLRREFDVELPLRTVFESPTPAGLALAIDAARFAAATQLPPIEPVPREELIPLSYAQEGAWFAEQMAPGNPFHIPLALPLEGELDLERLERALAKLMERHESLRTSFAAIDGQPHQVIHQLPPAPLEVVDLRRVEEDAERTRELIQAMIDTAAQPFDLGQGPLFQIKVFRLADEQQVLFFRAHHIVFDGYSVAIFARDLAALYDSEATGLPAALPPLPIQYPDYAAWQRRILSGEYLESQLDYWRTQLQGCPPGLLLAAAGRGRARESDTVSALLTPELSSALRVLSQQEGCTLFMVMLAAFKALLARYTGQEDIVVGTTVANRNQPEMAEVIGFCVNLLALRTDLSGNPSFRELVRRERQTCLGAYSHQELPFGVMVKHLRLDAQLGKSPFVTLGFGLNQVAGGAAEPLSPDPGSKLNDGLEILRGELERRWGDLTPPTELMYLQVVDSGDRIAAVLHHSSSLWGKGTLNRMIGHLETLLAGAVAAPDTPLHQLPLLEPEERAQLLTGFNPKEVEPPAGVALHQLLEQQAELTPDAVAVVVPGSSSEGWAEEQRLSYAQLNRRANQIARHLAGSGVGPESRVGICLERSPDLVAAVWGVLKTGAAYVPLDLSYGVERVKFMLADSGATLVVTHRALIDSSLGVEVTVVDLDQQAESIAAQPDTNLAVAVDPEQLAYLIYTSGSTGRPKGVMVSQRSLLVTYHAWAKTYRLDQLRAHLQMASFSFDVFAGDLVRALCSGAALVLCPREALLQPEELTGIIERYRIDCAEFVPAVIRPLIEHLEQDRVSLSSLKLVVVGADLWYGSEYHQLANLLGPGVRLINSYGVTEATIDNLYYQRREGELAAEAPVPIGLPYPNCRIYLLDPYLGLVPPGAAGELYLGGSAVARGYAGRPDLSAERFVPDPFGELAGQRLYRTGDRARYLPDGNLAFLGRSDYQIKIRGFRIEPGEIEAVLEQHPAVGQAVVIGRGEEPESQQLAAYLVASGEAPPTPAQLRAHLEKSLPAHMVPASFTVLESLPLTPSGKVDRQSLPDPDGARAQLREYLAPRSPQEARLALIWGEVLGVERVGVYDDFFAHGGHSLLAAKLVARLRREFDVELPLRTVFESPTPAGLALAIEAARFAAAAQLPPIEPVPREELIPLSYAQEGAWFAEQMAPGNPFHIPLALPLEGELDLERLERALARLMERHESLRTSFAAIDGQPHQVIHQLPPAPLEVVDMRRVEEEAERTRELIQAMIDTAAQPFDLGQGPLFQIKVFRLADEQQVLFFRAHHIVFDGYSVAIFARDLAALYDSELTGLPPSLPPLPIQYPDYAAWQRRVLSGEYLESQLDYWRTQLQGCPPGLVLGAAGRGRARESDTVSALLTPELSSALRALSQQEGCTLFMVMLAAFKALLARYTGQEDIVVGTTVANRNQPEMAEVIGFCVNLLALRTDLSGNPSFRELVRRERQTCLGAYSHQELPFGVMVKHLRLDAQLGKSPFVTLGFGLNQDGRAAVAPNQVFGSAVGGQELDRTSAQDLQILREKLKERWGDLTPPTELMYLQVVDSGDRIAAVLHHSSSLWGKGTLNRMIGHLETLLAGAVAAPDTPLHQLPLLEEAERTQLVSGFNPAEVEPPAGVALHQLLEHQAELTPDAVAVVVPGSSSEGWAEEQRLSYAQLNRRANQIARHLAGRGVGPESRVGICLERSPDLVAAVWGVLKTGAAYVPLDLSYGVERVKFMLADSGATLVVTHRALIDSSLGVEVTVVDLDQQAESIAAQPTANPGIAVDQDQLAYLIYTSGSTGRPKGVMVTQRSLLVTYRAWEQVYRLEELHAHLQMASFSFDVFAGDLVRALCSGAALVLCPREALLQPEELTGIIERYRIDCAEFVPAVIRPLIEHLEHSRVSLDSLQLVVVGADVWYGSEYHQLADLLGPGVRLINSYGVTEATIDNLYYERGTGELAAQAPVPIGLPYPNCRLYLLDPYLNLVPPGAAGELYLGGAAVARGYAGRPDLSAERFLPDPFGELAGQRLYRTGDRARYLPDGNLAFLGRSDYQIKIRGFRIEPGEIEAVLEQHPAVGQAVVIGRGEGPESQRLAAYLVASGEAPPTPAELRAHLEKSLPAHMVPASFTVLESLPLTPSGKVDRQSLPDPDGARAQLREYVAPRSPQEARLALIWGEVLGVERVGVYDDFFAHGGHSLLAAKLVARLRREFDVELPLRTVFESPTPAGLALAIEAARFAAATQLPPIEPVPREELIPLSYAQEGAWFAEQMAPGNPFHIPLALPLEGELDLERLERALAKLMERHESLRTSFAAIDGQPHQVIHQLPPAPLEVVDLRRVGEEAERTRELIQAMIDSAAQPFDLGQGPLFQIKVFRLADEQQVLFFRAHHIVFDGYSVAIFARDLAALYDSEATGLPAALPPLPIQYPDYAAWQRRILSGEYLESQLDYWRTQLQGCPPGLLLAAAGRGRARESDTVSAVLTPELSSALRVLSQQEGCTLFMVMLAAFKTLLARYTGQEDIVVGTTVANRNQPEMAEVIGFCVNLLALRTDLSGNPSFRELVRRERQTCLGAYSHQELPFGVMVKHLRLDAQLGKSPFVTLGFGLNQVAGGAAEPLSPDPGSKLNDGLEILRGELERRWGDLTPPTELMYLQVVDSGDRIAAVLHHSSSLWGKGTLNRMIGHLETLLAGAVAAPDTPLHQLPLLEEAERTQLVSGFNPAEVEPPAGVALHQLLEHQAELTPDAVAVVVPGSSSEGWAEEQRLSYAQLNRRANQIARHLAGRGVGPESRVGICLERSPDLVAAVWGVLKTGAAYVPLDLSYGVERVKFMLADSGAALVVTHRALIDSSLGVEVTVVDLDQQAESIAAQPDTNLAVAVEPEQLAYLIYTSGSTGRPKGVMVSQRSLLVTYHAWEQVYRLDQLRAHLQMASFSFDVFAGDLVRSLCSGAALVLCPREALLQPEELTGIIERYRIDCAEFVPAVIRPLIEHLEQDRVSLSSLKLVVVGADLWYGSEYHQLADLLGPGVRLINSYGVTEATIDNLYYERGTGELAAQAPVPIGLPYPNCRLYLLDPYLNLVPPGAAGELYLGGAAVARGYAGRPDLSAERFLPDPFGELAGQRLYRTGDRARYLPDGNLAFLGRSDYQIKIRGFRIEPGEIEAVLEQHPAVGQAVVIGRGEEPESQQLAAYLVASGEAPPTPAQLRAHLEKSLPAHMVPASFTVLESLPLTPSGKVDRQSLPDPDGARAQLREYLAPRSPQEARLALIWGEVLGVERVGVYDDFFAHGGHSLLAAKLVARLRREFDVELPLRTVFESPTPAGLALAIEAARFAAATQLPPIEPVPREELIPLSYAQEGAWFAEQMAPGNPFHIPLALPLEGELDLERLERALAKLMERHESLRTSFAAIDGQPHQVIHQLPPAPLEVVDLRRVGEEAERTRELIQAMIDSAAQPFDLGQGPLFQIKVFRLADEQQVLFFRAHHIVFDGYSVAIFARDLAALYDSEATGLPAALPPLPIQYPDYAAWQRRILSGEYLESQLDYWRTQLQGCPPGLLLAAAGRGRARESDTVSALLTPELSSALRVLSQQEGCTLFMVMLAAFKALLARYTGQEDIVVGTTVANRNQPEMAEVIGFCVNLLALRTDLSGNPSFRELVRRERQTCLGAYSHQELPFGVMVKHLRLDAQLGKSPFVTLGFGLNQVAGGAAEPLSPDPGSKLNDGLEILRGELERRWGGLEPLTPPTELMYLQVVDSGDRIAAVLHHSSSLWGKGTLNRMIGHLETLLAGAVAAPDTPLHQLPLLEPEERAQLLTGFNPKEVEPPAGVALHQLLEQQAELTPDAVAVVVPGSSSEGWAEEQRLSYAQLNRRANQIARHLAGSGVGPESRVGICLERSPDLVAAVWGVLKTGAAYVPLDLSYGVERVKFMLADSGATLVVTHRALIDSSLGVEVTVVDLDQQAESIAAQPDTNLAVAVDPEQLAYLIYTSGSTGRPKGVMVSQRSLLVTYHAWAKTYRLDQLRAHLQMASFSFDVFAGDLVRALCSGAALVLCPREALLQPEELTGIIERYRVDCAEFVPAVIRPLIEHLEQDRVSLSSLKLVVVGADLWYGSEYHQLANLLGPGVRLINSYGVTEATIDNLYYQRREGELAAEAPVPIGLPYPNCRIYLLDPYLGLVPPGAAGELYLGGSAVARGYAGRPDLSSERFVPDPFGELAGQRLYRTGDRARYLPDGNLAFLGRADYQIKIRGFRIEPGEIEAVLEQHPAVGQAVVIGRGEGPESQRLAAYLVASGDAPPTPAELRAHLEKSLPAHMVPASFTVLESLPLTPSGKVDRPRLPDPDGARAQLREYVAPRSPQEASLAQIWGEVLGVERVGIYDDFFALGGYSLLAAKLVARIRIELKVNLPLRALFEHPTVANLTHEIETALVMGAIPELEVDLAAEAVLPEDIVPGGEPEPGSDKPANVLLTGATGFLGAFLLKELLEQTDAVVHCLVRAASKPEGMRRIQTMLEGLGLWEAAFPERIVPVLGDLAEVRFGLSEEGYDELCRSIDAIYHSGAWVNFIYPYAMLKAANVSGTEEVLRLACRMPVKPLHHVSTLSVFPPSRWAEGTVVEDFRLDLSEVPHGGYAESKWVADQLVGAAAERGLPVTIFRPGRVTGDSRTGATTEVMGLEAFESVLKLGVAPDLPSPRAMEVVPVDYVAKAIVHLSLQPGSVRKAFHLINQHPASLQEVVDALRRAGYQLEEIDPQQWLARLYDHLRTSFASELSEVLSYVPAEFVEAIEQWRAGVAVGELDQAPPREPVPLSRPVELAPPAGGVDCRNTLAGLEGSGIVCPPTADLLDVYIGHALRSGRLSGPAADEPDPAEVR